MRCSRRRKAARLSLGVRRHSDIRVMIENERAKRDLIKAYFDEADQRVAFLVHLARECHGQEAMTLGLTYIDSFAQWLCWPSTQTGRNFVDAVVRFGGDPELGLIHSKPNGPSGR